MFQCNFAKESLFLLLYAIIFLDMLFLGYCLTQGCQTPFTLWGTLKKKCSFNNTSVFLFCLFYMIKKLTFFFLAHCADCHVIINWKIYCLKKKSQISQFIVEKTDFCLFLFFLIVYLLHIYFGVVSMVTGELLSVENALKPAKIHLKSLHFLKPSPGPDWRLHRANSGPRALCLIPLVQF